MTCKEIEERFSVKSSTARNWAAANGVAFIGEGKRKTYQWTEDDCLRFAARPPKGWKKGKHRKAKG
jgi:hypothetical protein